MRIQIHEMTPAARAFDDTATAYVHPALATLDQAPLDPTPREALDGPQWSGARLAADSIVSTGGAASVERESAAALEGMLAMLALRDSEVYEHAYRVSALSMEMARVMGVSASGAMLVERAALLHDIGWTAPLPGRSTYEPLPTNASERESICALEQGGAILDGLWPYLAGTADILRAMPEWFAGPEARNTDEAIPLGSRIVAVADAYDTLVSSPGGAVSPMDALADVQRLSGTRFDPQVVKALGVTLFGRN